MIAAFALDQSADKLPFHAFSHWGCYVNGIVNLRKLELFARVMPDFKLLQVHAVTQAGNPHSASITG